MTGLIHPLLEEDVVGHEWMVELLVHTRPDGGRRAVFRPVCECGWRGSETRDGDRVDRSLVAHLLKATAVGRRDAS